MQKTIIYIIVSCLFLTACLSSQPEEQLNTCNVIAERSIKDNDTLWVADMNKITQTVTIPLSFLLSDWRLMKLEGSSKEMMVSPINRIYPSENHLISDDSNNGVLLFDKKGNFECSVAKIGNGPADIEPGVTGIQIDETKGVIYLTTGYRDKMKLYALKDAAFLGEIPLSFRTILPSYIVNSHDSTILITDVPMKDAPVVLWKQDFHGNKLQMIKSDRFQNTKGFWMIGEDAFYIWKNRQKKTTLAVLRNPAVNDSLYHYDEIGNRLRPCFAVNFSGEVPDHWIYETSDYYMVTINGSNSEDITPGYHNGPQKRIIVDKNTGRGAYAHVVLDGYGNIPITKQRFYMWSDYFTLGLSPEWVAEMAEKALAHPEYLKPEEKERLQALLDGMTEEDNSFVLYGKIK